MKLVALLTALVLLASPTQAQAGRLAVDSAVARQLVEAWHRQPGDTLACLLGHTEGEAVVADSVAFRMACGGPGVVGLLGFISEPESREDAVLVAMLDVLRHRPDLYVVGEVYGVEPYNTGPGIAWGPRVWFAVRPPKPGVKA